MSDATVSSEFRAACEREFAEIHAKLDRLDAALRGNGQPGITVRLDRLEQDARRYARLVWLILGTLATTVASVLSAWVR